MKLVLAQKEPIGGGVVSFVFDAPEGFTWKPGQYSHYTLPHSNPDDRDIRRWFTIAAPPYEGKPRITTRISREKGSSFKRALMDLKPGETIEAEAPEGDFVLDDLRKEYVLIAGGIGFTPFHSILMELAHQGELPKVTVLYGARDNEPTFHEELGVLAKKHPQLQVHYVIEPQRINEAIIKQYVRDIETPSFYISGPEPMVDAFDEMLLKMGVSKDNLHKDHFPGYTW